MKGYCKKCGAEIYISSGVFFGDQYICSKCKGERRL